MIWLKRLLPFVVLAAAWYGYDYYRKQQYAEEVSQADQIAQTTARLWLANADLRPDSVAYLAFRDSLLSANGLTIEGIEAYMARVQAQPQKHDTFAVMLTYYVDSLAHKPSNSVEAEPAVLDTTAHE